MRIENEQESANIEDHRGNAGYSSAGFGGGGGAAGIILPLLFRTIGFRGMIILAVIYFGLKLFAGFDLLSMVNGGGGGIGFPTQASQIQPGGNTQIGKGSAGNSAESDAGKRFVAKILNSTDEVWTKNFAGMGKTYEKPVLVLYSGMDSRGSGCGQVTAAAGPFYCPADNKVYIDLSFYQEMKDKLGAPGEFAQAYVIAHEVGHHVQTMLGITQQVDSARSRSGEAAANRLSVRTELQADCFAGIWAQDLAESTSIRLENGDIEQALNAASQIGDDHLQANAGRRPMPDTFTHGTSAQRVKWFKQGFTARSMQDCDTFSASNLG